jgi:hypothetical protein
MIAVVLDPQIFIDNIAAEREESDVLSDQERARCRTSAMNEERFGRD